MKKCVIIYKCWTSDNQKILFKHVQYIYPQNARQQFLTLFKNKYKFKKNYFSLSTLN